MAAGASQPTCTMFRRLGPVQNVVIFGEHAPAVIPLLCGFDLMTTRVLLHCSWCSALVSINQSLLLSNSMLQIQSTDSQCDCEGTVTHARHAFQARSVQPRICCLLAVPWRGVVYQHLPALWTVKSQNKYVTVKNTSTVALWSCINAFVLVYLRIQLDRTVHKPD